MGLPYILALLICVGGSSNVATLEGSKTNKASIQGLGDAAVGTAMSNDKLSLPIMADLIPRGDGSYILRPRAPAQLGQWIDPMSAAKILGVSRSSVYRLCYEGKLVSRHIRRRLQVRVDSLLAYAREAEDMSD